MVEWKEIEITDGLYSCSSDGLIRSNKSGKVLSGCINPDGYRSIGLKMPTGKHKSFLYHRIVAMTWHDNPDNLSQVDHKDKNKLNNHPSNLEWVSPRENLMRRDNTTFRETHTLVSPEGEVVEVVSTYQFSKKYELHNESIQALIKGRIKTHKGWKILGD